MPLPSFLVIDRALQRKYNALPSPQLHTYLQRTSAHKSLLFFKPTPCYVPDLRNDLTLLPRLLSWPTKDRS